MKGAILEVLLVSAEGIDHTNVIGNSGYHVVIECGTQMCRSKISSENEDKIYWNEKFTLELLPPEVETVSHLKFKIVGEEYFADAECVGETTIFLEAIIMEGKLSGVIELSPAPFSVVLQDDSYKGEITIGLKYIPNATLQMKKRQYAQEENDQGKSIYKRILNLWQMNWWRIFHSCGNINSINKHKDV